LRLEAGNGGYRRGIENGRANYQPTEESWIDILMDLEYLTELLRS
jgi:hypothetical protein